jgi:hypothetical protein
MGKNKEVFLTNLIIVSVGVFFAQDLVSHAATLNPDQSKQIVKACDYL